MTKIFITYSNVNGIIRIFRNEDVINKLKNNKGATNNESCFQKSKSKLRGCRGY